jgi:hypothetical protein
MKVNRAISDLELGNNYSAKEDVKDLKNKFD